MEVKFPDDPEETKNVEERQRQQLQQNAVLLAGLTSHLNGLNHRLDIMMIEVRQTVAAVDKIALEMAQVKIFYQELSFILPALRKLIGRNL